MKAIIVTSHGPFAQGILESAKFFEGNLACLEAVVLLEDDSPELFRDRLEKTIQKVDNGEGIIILVDIPGGTPCNQSLLVSLTRDDIEVVSGLNMMMLLQALLARDNSNSILDLSESAIDAGIRSISSMSTQMRNKSKSGDLNIGDEF